MRLVNIDEKVQKLSLKTAIDEFIGAKKSQGSSELTLKDYNSYLTKFYEVSSNELDADILKSDCKQFFGAIPNTSPARFNHPYQYINAFLNWCVDAEYISYNPIKKLGLKKKRDDGHIQSISIDDAKELLKVMNTHTFAGLRDKTITLIMLDTGMRPKEIFGLVNDDIDFNNACIHVSKQIAKTRTERTVFISNYTVKHLLKLIKVKPEIWGDKVITTNEGKDFNVRYLDKQFAKYSKLIGIKITPYQLRHTFATLYLKNGGNVFTLQRSLGHSDLRMTKRYLDIDNEYLKEQHDNATPLNQIISTKLSNID